MSFSVDLWNGFDLIKPQILSVQKKIKTISKVLSTYLTIESNYNKGLENLYKEFKEASNSEYLLDKSYIKILDIFEYENQNRKIFYSFVTQLIMEPLNEYLRQPAIPLNKYFTDNTLNEETFKRSLNILKDKQANYWRDCKELSVLLAQNEIEDILNTNDKKSSRTRLLKINEKFNKVNMSKQEYVDYMVEANKEREKYNKKTEDILNNLEQIYTTMVETLSNVLTNFSLQRNEFLKKMYIKEKNEYENLHIKVNPKEELFNFITNNATKEFPKIKFEFCPMKYSTLNQNIKSKCNKIPESSFPKVYKAVKEFFEENKIFKEENPFKITRRNTEVFGIFSKKSSRNAIRNNQNETEQNKEFIEKYITDLFINKPSNDEPKSEKNIQNPIINVDKQEESEKIKNNNETKQNNNNEQNQKENGNKNEIEINNQKENTNNLKNQETEQKNEKQEENINKKEKVNDEQAKEETKKETENNKDNNEIKTNTQNIDKKDNNNEEKQKLNKSLSKEGEEKISSNNENIQSTEEKTAIQAFFYSENPNYFQNAEILIKKLSYLRSKGHFQISYDAYYQILSLFFIILNQESKDYYILKNILILSQTFYKIKDNKKIYLQEGLRGMKAFTTSEAWHRVINYSMNLSCSSMDLTQTKEDMIEKINKEAQIIVVAYLCDIKQYTVNDDIFNEVKNYYVKVYKMDEETVNKEVEKYVNSLEKNESSAQEKHIKFEEKNKNEDDVENDSDKNLNNINELEENNFTKQRSYSTPINIIENNTTSNNIENEIQKTKTDKEMNVPKEKDISDISDSHEDSKKIEVNNTNNNNNNNENPDNKNQIINNNINIIKIEAKEVIIVDNSKNNIDIGQIKEIKKDNKDILEENNVKIDDTKEKKKNKKNNDSKKDIKQKGKK